MGEMGLIFGKSISKNVANYIKEQIKQFYFENGQSKEIVHKIFGLKFDEKMEAFSVENLMD